MEEAGVGSLLDDSLYIQARVCLPETADAPTKSPFGPADLACQGSGQIAAHAGPADTTGAATYGNCCTRQRSQPAVGGGGKSHFGGPAIVTSADIKGAATYFAGNLCSRQRSQPAVGGGGKSPK